MGVEEEEEVVEDDEDDKEADKGEELDEKEA